MPFFSTWYQIISSWTNLCELRRFGKNSHPLKVRWLTPVQPLPTEQWKMNSQKLNTFVLIPSRYPHHKMQDLFVCQTVLIESEWVWCMFQGYVGTMVELKVPFKQTFIATVMQKCSRHHRGTESESKKASRKPRSFDQSGSLKGMRWDWCFRYRKPAGVTWSRIVYIGLHWI